MSKAEARVIRAAMRWFRRYENWYYENGRKGEPAMELCKACAALQSKRRRKP